MPDISTERINQYPGAVETQTVNYGAVQFLPEYGF